MSCYTWVVTTTRSPRQDNSSVHRKRSLLPRAIFLLAFTLDEQLYKEMGNQGSKCIKLDWYTRSLTHFHSNTPTHHGRVGHYHFHITMSSPTTDIPSTGFQLFWMTSLEILSIWIVSASCSVWPKVYREQYMRWFHPGLWSGDGLSAKKKTDHKQQPKKTVRHWDHTKRNFGQVSWLDSP